MYFHDSQCNKIHTQPKDSEVAQPETGHFWEARSEWWDPILQEEGRSLGQGTHLSRKGYPFGLLLCTPRRGKSTALLITEFISTATDNVGNEFRRKEKIKFNALTSSVMSVAIDLPISWYCGPLP